MRCRRKFDSQVVGCSSPVSQHSNESPAHKIDLTVLFRDTITLKIAFFFVQKLYTKFNVQYVTELIAVIASQSLQNHYCANVCLVFYMSGKYQYIRLAKPYLLYKFIYRTRTMNPRRAREFFFSPTFSQSTGEELTPLFHFATPSKKWRSKKTEIIQVRNNSRICGWSRFCTICWFDGRLIACLIWMVNPGLAISLFAHRTAVAQW